MDFKPACDTVISGHVLVPRDAEQIKEKYWRVMQCTECGLMVIRTNMGQILLTGDFFEENSDGPCGV